MLTFQKWICIIVCASKGGREHELLDLKCIPGKCFSRMTHCLYMTLKVTLKF